MVIKDRKFKIAVLLIFTGVAFVPLCALNKDLIELAVPYYTFLGVIGSGFFAANLGEAVSKNKGVKNADIIPDTNNPV